MLQDILRFVSPTWAKYTVLVIQRHCGQTCNTHLTGREVVRSPWVRGSPAIFFWTILVNFWKKILGFKDRILGNREFQVKSDRTFHVSSRDKD